jgi:hypothetical protein
MHFTLVLSSIVCILGGFCFVLVAASSAAVFIILMIALALACAFLGIGTAYTSCARLLGFIDIERSRADDDGQNNNQKYIN